MTTHDIKCDICNRHVSPGEVTETVSTCNVVDLAIGDLIGNDPSGKVCKLERMPAGTIMITAVGWRDAFEPDYEIGMSIIHQCDDCVPAYGASA